MMSTDWCHDDVLNWGYCNVSCEVVLSCRSAATVSRGWHVLSAFSMWCVVHSHKLCYAVTLWERQTVIFFFLNKEARGQLFGFRTLLSRCGARFGRLVLWCCAGCPRSGKRHRVRFTGQPSIHELPLIEEEPEEEAPSYPFASDKSDFDRSRAKAAIGGRPLDPEESGSVRRFLEHKQAARGDLVQATVFDGLLAEKRSENSARQQWATGRQPLPKREATNRAKKKTRGVTPTQVDQPIRPPDMPYFLMEDASMPLPSIGSTAIDRDAPVYDRASGSAH